MSLQKERQELAQGLLFSALSPLLLGASKNAQDTEEGALALESGDLGSNLSSTMCSLCELGQVTHPL